LQDGDALHTPPYDQCLNTPFQCIPEPTGLAATIWGIFAEQGVAPLLPPNYGALAYSAAQSSLNAGDSLAIGTLTLILQTDGNLVFYNPQGKAVWSSGTYGQNCMPTRPFNALLCSRAMAILCCTTAPKLSGAVIPTDTPKRS
jgi:hypothetical protein